MKVLKKIIVFILCLILLFAAAAVCFYFVSTAGTNLDSAKLALTESSIEVYDAADEKIADFSYKSSNKSVRIENLPECVPKAFVSAEDKNFYSHHGLDYKGMARALYKNIKARTFKQGASTISQQLIKNTQLTSEKTLTRKLKEIKLTKQLEKKFSKDQIMEMYLNTIYFGHACYGIAGAADFYFGKDASELCPAEAATLAALIRSPNNYSPFVNPEKCLHARNSVLKRMHTLGYISESEYESAKKVALPEMQDNSITSKTYLSGVYAELEALPLYSPYRLRGLRVYTYMDKGMQEYAENLKTDADRSGKSILLCDNATRGIAAWYTTEGDIRRQPGSVIKPLAVYGPALEENLIAPCTPILDEKTNFGGYSPSNYKDAYKGYISVRQALAESLNVPAVKILNMLGCDTSEEYLFRMGLPISPQDKNLSLALGGITEGYTVREIAAAYAAIANTGNFAPLAFIRKIEDANGNLLYERSLAPTRVFSEDTVSLLNDMLLYAAKNGTAKKLASLPFEICAKTGTCGNENGNTDAWAVTYTADHTAAVWMGNADNTLTDITGGGLPCHYAMLLNKRLYANKMPSNFPVCPKITECRLDRISYEKDHAVRLAINDQPDQYTFVDIFREENQPQKYSDIFSLPKVTAEIRCSNSTVCIEVCEAEYYDYLIKRENDGNITTIYDGPFRKLVQDKSVLPKTKYIYSITPYYIDNSGKRHYGEKCVLPSVYLKANHAIKPPENWWK